jgi:ATP-dependent Lhr-like helicase
MDSLETWVQEHLSEPSDIQKLAWPALRKGGSALLVAPTGTGKTEAAIIPLLEDMRDHPGEPIAILYVSPLRALNRDLEGRLTALTRAAGLRAGVRHGDTPTKERTKQSQTPPHLLITTPETLQLLLIGKILRQGLSHVRTVIVDEVHEMAISDRGAQFAISLDRLDRLAGRTVRRIGLSATVGSPEEIAQYLSPSSPVQMLVVPSTKRLTITVSPPQPSIDEIPKGVRSGLAEDETFLAAVLTVLKEIREHNSTLVFTNTRPSAETLAAHLHRLAPELPVAVHHGSLSREVREEAEQAFREGKLKAMVATSSLELGIDIGVADHVVQFGSPHRVARLLQRVGRSGHRKDQASSGTIATIDGQDLEEAAVLARRALNGMVESITVRRRNILALAQQIVAMVREGGDIDIDEAVRILCRALPSRDFSRQDVVDVAKFLQGLGCLWINGKTIGRGRRTLERFYSTISMIPEEKSYPLMEMGSRKVIGTLDERFVVTRVLSHPDFIFLLHGTTWRLVKFSEDGLLVEPVQEMGAPPHWEGDDIPVPFDAAQEIGRLRREENIGDYPLNPEAAQKLAIRLKSFTDSGVTPSDKVITVELHGRFLVLGCCFGTQVNSTIATLLAGLGTAKWGEKTEVMLVTPVWIILGLPGPVNAADIAELIRITPDYLEDLLARLLPHTEEYKWTFMVVARKLGLLSLSYDANEVKTLEPLMVAHQSSIVGEEALQKVLHEKFDVTHTKEVMERLSRGEIAVEVVRKMENSPGREALERLHWQSLPDRPPPTLLKAVKDRLEKEELTMVCLRCGFKRNVTPASYPQKGSSPCLRCHGVLTAILSPRRRKEIDALTKYVITKKTAKPRGPERLGRRRHVSREPPRVKSVAAAYLSAELLATYGTRALLVLAGRGIGPETARRILGRPYENEQALVAEILRAERNYARTREFWD